MNTHNFSIWPGLALLLCRSPPPEPTVLLNNHAYFTGSSPPDPYEGASELHLPWPRIAPGSSPCSPGAWTHVLKIHLRVCKNNTGAPGSLKK